VSLLALWWLAGQDLGDLGPSLWISLAIAAGYGSAMSLRGAGVEPFLYLVGTAALLRGLCIARRRTLSRQGGVELAGVALLGFGLFKHGFLRYDAEHTFIAAFGLLAIALVYSSTGLWGIADVSLGVRAGYTLAMVAGCTGLALWPYLSMPYLPTLREQVSALLHPVASMERYTSQFTAVNQSIAERAPFCDLVGPTDIISYRQLVLFANGKSGVPSAVRRRRTGTTRENTYWVSRQKQPRQACPRAQAGSFEQVNGHFR
jgi:hypothetical protein